MFLLPLGDSTITMGNCFKSQAGDDISLLNDSASYAGEGAGAGGGIAGPGARGRGRAGPGTMHRPPAAASPPQQVGAGLHTHCIRISPCSSLYSSAA